MREPRLNAFRAAQLEAVPFRTLGGDIAHAIGRWTGEKPPLLTLPTIVPLAVSTRAPLAPAGAIDSNPTRFWARAAGDLGLDPRRAVDPPSARRRL